MNVFKLKQVIMVLGLVTISFATLYFGSLYDDPHLTEFGNFFLCVVVVHMLYHYYLHADISKSQNIIVDRMANKTADLVGSHIDGLASAAGVCHKLGIERVYDKDPRPLNKEKLLELKEGDSVLCVGRTLCKLFDTCTDEIVISIENGVNFKFAMCHYKTCIDSELEFLVDTDIHDYKILFDHILKIESNLKKVEDYKGSLELWFHSNYLPDTLLVINQKGNPKETYWIHAFGRGKSDKMAFQFSQNNQQDNRSMGLFNRFNKILQSQNDTSVWTERKPDLRIAVDEKEGEIKKYHTEFLNNI